MSQENVEIVRRIYEELLYRKADWVLDLWDPVGDYYPVAKFPESRPCHGVEEIASFHSEFRQAWEQLDARIRSITAVGDDRVLVRLGLMAEGKESGLSLEGDMFHCFWLRHGRIFRQEDHLTLPGALRALGLQGETLEAVGLSE
jgi:hypothetical protein